MYKTISQRPDWLKNEQVCDIYSVSRCISEDFSDWSIYWKHNGHWFFDKPEIMKDLAAEHSFSLDGMTLFYYLAFEEQWDGDNEKWVTYEPDTSFSINVVRPRETVLQGYDIVSFSCQTSAECSPLSCNHLAQDLKVNRHCLLATFEEAKKHLESGQIKRCEPGPYRIFEVHTVVSN